MLMRNKKQTKTKGKKEKDMSGFDVNVIPHYMTVIAVTSASIEARMIS